MEAAFDRHSSEVEKSRENDRPAGATLTGDEGTMGAEC